MDQLICPTCNEPADFTVSEDWPPTAYAVSADREVVELDGQGQRESEITCDKCGETPDGDLWEEIYELSQG